MGRRKFSVRFDRQGRRMTALKSPKPPKPHKHEAIKARRSIYLGPVTHKAPYEAQGGYCRIEECSCKATRKTNVNGVHTERGVWQIQEYVTSMLSGACRKTSV